MASPIERAAEQMTFGGGRGPVVIVSARVADYLNRHAGLGLYRKTHRGHDPEVDAALLALAVVGGAWSGTGTGTSVAAPAEPVRRSTSLGSAEAAARLGITSRAVRRAIAEDRLKATRIGNAWRINTADIEHYRARRPH